MNARIYCHVDGIQLSVEWVDEYGQAIESRITIPDSMDAYRAAMQVEQYRIMNLGIMSFLSARDIKTRDVKP